MTTKTFKGLAGKSSISDLSRISRTQFSQAFAQTATRLGYVQSKVTNPEEMARQCKIALDRVSRVIPALDRIGLDQERREVEDIIGKARNLTFAAMFIDRRYSKNMDLLIATRKAFRKLQNDFM